jgi:hypothetical protein
VGNVSSTTAQSELRELVVFKAASQSHGRCGVVHHDPDSLGIAGRTLGHLHEQEANLRLLTLVAEV